MYVVMMVNARKRGSSLAAISNSSHGSRVTSFTPKRNADR